VWAGWGLVEFACVLDFCSLLPSGGLLARGAGSRALSGCCAAGCFWGSPWFVGGQRFATCPHTRLLEAVVLAAGWPCILGRGNYGADGRVGQLVAGWCVYSAPTRDAGLIRFVPLLDEQPTLSRTQRSLILWISAVSAS